MSGTVESIPAPNQHQNTPSIDALNARLEEDARIQAAGGTDEVKETIQRKKEYPTPVVTEQEPVEDPKEESKEEVEAFNDDSEEVKEENDEPKEEHKEDDSAKRIARLAYERREAQKQLRQANEEIARLKGEKPAPTPDEEFERRVEEAAARKSEEKRFMDRCAEVRKAGDKEFGDFGKSLEELNSIGALPNHVIEAILETDAPTKVIDHLAKNLDLAEEIMKMKPHQMGVSLAKMATKITAPKPVVVKPQSKAPAPIKPVTGSAKAVPNAETMSIREFMRLEDEKGSTRRRYS